LSDITSLTNADFIRFVEMIRQAHASSTDGITLRNRLDKLMAGAFADANFRKKRSFYPIKTRLVHLFTQVLVADGEINEAHELLRVRSSDPALATSSTLIAMQVTLLCMRAVLYLLSHPQATGPLTIPTLAEFCSNMFTFTSVIMALKTKQKKAFLRQNIGWPETAAQMIRDLQLAFQSTAGRVDKCLTYETLRVAFYMATDQSIQVIIIS